MSIDWDTELLEPLYSEFGKEAVTDIGSPPATLVVIDKTAGVEIATHDIDQPSISPAACVRVSEMAGKGIAEEDLIDATVTIDGKAWTVTNVHSRPVDGKGTGELMLILLDGDL